MTGSWLADKFWNATHRVPWLRKHGAFRYCRQHYPELTRDRMGAMWQQAASEPAYCSVIGTTATITVRFFTHVSSWRHDASDEYRCVEGCCVVIWFNGRNTGGYGPAGCPCDTMDDPRGELLKTGTR